MPTLEIDNLEAGYGDVQILWGINLNLQDGILTAVVGGNGVGKTTMLHAIMGTVKPWEGSIKLDGAEIGHLPAYRKADLGLVLVPEGRQLFSTMSVSENLEMGATNHRSRSRIAQNLERVYDLFPRLEERKRQQAGTLSGGEQQMLAVARGLMAEPKVLMFDELSLGLAPVLVLDLFETLKQLKAEGLTMLLVEQNVHLALSISDYAYVLSEGRVTLEGDAEEVAADRSVQRAYLGI
jgi:branched-chain amino acid transport system ATP-binding protein